jgi:predicted permease
MHEEMGAHLDQAVERLKRRGLSDAAAREAARREFGNVGYLQEEARDARGGRWVESLLGDVRFALRHFARTPLTAITLVLVLALGIGVNSALFAILQALTMRPPPGIPAADALVRIRGSALSRAEGRLAPRELSLPELNAIASHREAFSAVAGFAWDQVVLDVGDGSELRPMSGHFVTPNFFATLGIRPAIGPGLPVGRTDDAPGAELAVVISHRLWEQIGGDTAIVGRVVRMNGVPVRVVGVAPPRFYGVELSGERSFWMPIEARAAITQSTSHALTSRDSTLFEAVARLTPNTSVERASAVARVVAATWAPQVPQSEDVKEHSTDVVPLRGFTDVGADGEALAIIALVGTGGLLVLLIACTNVSALLVGAGVARRREFAIRLSLGASRGRVIRQLLTETSIIALAGGALGLTLYWWITRLVAWLVADIGIQPDLGTVGFTTAIALGTGIVFGLSPALHATRLDVAGALKDASGGATSRTRLQRGFIVAQIALTQPLLVGVAMVIGITLVESGGGREDRMAGRLVQVSFSMQGGVGSFEAKAARIREVMDRVAALPGVEAVGPKTAGFATGQLRVQASDRGGGPRAQESVQANLIGTAPGYFALQGVSMLRGRELALTDTASGGDMAVVVDTELARGFWGTDDPIGKRMDVTSRGFEGEQRPRTAVVVGVFDTTRVAAGGPAPVYTADGAHWGKSSYLVRTTGPGTAVIPAIRQLARSEIPDIPIYNRGLLTLEQLTRIERNEVMQIGAGVSGGGLLALLLASIGLYGVVALAVRQRQREIGVRIALGARPRQVVGMFLASGLRLSAVGIVVGLPLSVVALRFLALSFADVDHMPINMPLVGAAIAVVVVAVASLASWIPARKAARVDPIVTLKTE